MDSNNAPRRGHSILGWLILLTGASALWYGLNAQASAIARNDDELAGVSVVVGLLLAALGALLARHAGDRHMPGLVLAVTGAVALASGGTDIAEGYASYYAFYGGLISIGLGLLLATVGNRGATLRPSTLERPTSDA